MKYKHYNLLKATAASLAIAASAHGATVLKLDTGKLDDDASWDGGIKPSASDIGLYDDTTVPSASGNTFDGQGFYSGGYQITNIAGPLNIGRITFIEPGSIIDMSAATADVSFTGNLRSSGPLAGSTYSIVVAPGRTLRINDQTFSRNAYTQPISGGGTVLVNGTTGGPGSSANVRVAYEVSGVGTTIGGNGTWAPNNTNGGYGIRMTDGTYISPGDNGVGTMTISGAGSGETILVMQSGSGFQFELGTGGDVDIPSVDSDMISLMAMAAGDIQFNDNNIDFLGTGSAGWFKLFDTDLDESTYTGLSLTGQEITGGLTFSNLANGLEGTLLMGDGINGDAGDIYLFVIPEPSVALLGSLALLGLLRRRR